MHICNSQIPEVGGELMCQLAWSEMTETRDRATELQKLTQYGGKLKTDLWLPHTPVQLCTCTHKENSRKRKGEVIKERREKWGKVGWNELSVSYLLKHLLPCPTLLEVCGCHYLKPKALLLLSCPPHVLSLSVVHLVRVKLHVFFTGFYNPVLSGLFMYLLCYFLSPLGFFLTFQDGLNKDVRAYLWFCYLSPSL